MVVIQQHIERGVGRSVLKDCRADLTEQGSWRNILLHVRLLATLHHQERKLREQLYTRAASRSSLEGSGHSPGLVEDH